MSKIPTTMDMGVLCVVEPCVMNLGSGNARMHVVKQVNGLADEVVVAVFANKAHAKHYADWLMETGKGVTQ